VDMPVRAAREPGLDPGILLRGVVVHHQMNVPTFRYDLVDLLQAVEELGRPVALVAFADHRSCRDVERGKQRGRAVADVGVSSSLGAIGNTGCSRSGAWIWVFSSTHSTIARFGGAM